MLTDPTLKSKVDALWDRFWSGGISNPLTAIEQMSYLIFLKRLEDMDNARTASAKRRGTPYKSVFRANQKCHGEIVCKPLLFSLLCICQSINCCSSTRKKEHT